MKKILIIDDEPILLEVLCELFQMDQWQVEFCSESPMAMDKIQQFQPDVILSDINMPSLSGLQLLEMIYNAKIITPVVFLTGYRDTEKMQKAWQYCAFDFIDKPYNSNHLIKTCESAFEFGKDYVKIARARFETFVERKKKVAG